MSRRDEALLWVADHGPGISPAERERIFERFVRAPVAHRADGAGLGLAIVRAIAEGHGGRIELDTAEGVGSRFTIVIPTEPRPEANPSADPPPARATIDDEDTTETEARP
jgi:signal transduction histidine kinase